ncbi:unnamed protein product, partial [Effrenium voratum]
RPGAGGQSHRLVPAAPQRSYGLDDGGREFDPWPGGRSLRRLRAPGWADRLLRPQSPRRSGERPELQRLQELRGLVLEPCRR